MNPTDYNHTLLSALPGISRRRPKLVIPTLHNQLPTIPTFNRPPSFADSQPRSQSHTLSPLSQEDISPSLPHTPLEQITHTPLLPPEMPRFHRMKPTLHVTLAHQSSSGSNTPIISPRPPQDPATPLLHPLDTLRPSDVSANPRPLLRPRQLSYFHPATAVSDSPSIAKADSTRDAIPRVLRTESLASPLILFQPSFPSGLKRTP